MVVMNKRKLIKECKEEIKNIDSAFSLVKKIYEVDKKHYNQMLYLLQNEEDEK